MSLLLETSIFFFLVEGNSSTAPSAPIGSPGNQKQIDQYLITMSMKAYKTDKVASIIILQDFSLICQLFSKEANQNLLTLCRHVRLKDTSNKHSENKIEAILLATVEVFFFFSLFCLSMDIVEVL